MLAPLITSTSIVMRWMPAKVPGGEVKQFHIKYGTNGLTGTYTNTYQFLYLEPSKEYTFEIATENVNGGTGVYTPVTYKTG